MELKNERYEFGDTLVIDVVAEKDEKDIMMEGPGLIFMGGEEKTPGAEPGSDEE